MTRTTQPNTLLINRWFSQLDQGILSDVITHQITKHIAENGGFARMGQMLTISRQQDLQPNRASHVLGGLRILIAELIQKPVGYEWQPAWQLRGLKQGDVLRYSLPTHKGWSLMVRYSKDSTTEKLTVELTGAGVEAVLPVPLQLLSGDHLIEQIELDESGEATFRNLLPGNYSLQLLLPEASIQAAGIVVKADTPET
jgi:hypothetical protein